MYVVREKIQDPPRAGVDNFFHKCAKISKGFRDFEGIKAHWIFSFFCFNIALF